VAFGVGEAERLGSLTASLGHKALLVTGASFARESGLAARLERVLGEAGVAVVQVSSSGEPDAGTVDLAALKGRETGVDVVVAVGGGSVLDLGKCAAGIIPNEGSIRDYLEGIGSGAVMKRDPLPFIAVPTTAGTGSEATRNAVVTWKDGRAKKSFRDSRLVPKIALVDPELGLTAPPELTAACGMDALTQLIEPLTSLNALPFTDALAVSGLEALGPSLPRAVERGRDLDARTGMAYAALLSGMALSNAGLGAVHGLAGPLGARFPVPHSVACARLLPAVTAANIAALEAGRGPRRSLDGYRRAESALGGTVADYCGRFVFPGLSSFGMRRADIPAVIEAATSGSMKTNPVVLTAAELTAILEEAL